MRQKREQENKQNKTKQDDMFNKGEQRSKNRHFTKQHNGNKNSPSFYSMR